MTRLQKFDLTINAFLILMIRRTGIHPAWIRLIVNSALFCAVTAFVFGTQQDKFLVLVLCMGLLVLCFVTFLQALIDVFLVMTGKRDVVDAHIRKNQDILPRDSFAWQRPLWLIMSVTIALLTFPIPDLHKIGAFCSHTFTTSEGLTRLNI